MFDQTNSLLPLTESAHEFTLTADFAKPDTTVKVPLVSVDDFWAQHGITQIDILKTDAEGLDLAVIRGAAGMLAKTIVPLIYTEVFFVPADENQPLFQEGYEQLYKNDYRLVGIYESGHPTHFSTSAATPFSCTPPSAGERWLRFGRYEIYR